MNDGADRADLLTDSRDQRFHLRSIGEVGGEDVARADGRVGAVAEQQGTFALALQLIGQGGGKAGFIIGDQADTARIVLRLGRSCEACR